jgi:hypothetical protein
LDVVCPAQGCGFLLIATVVHQQNDIGRVMYAYDYVHISPAAAAAGNITQVLQDKYQGFLSRDIIEDFAYYADVAFKT